MASEKKCISVEKKNSILSETYQKNIDSSTKELREFRINRQDTEEMLNSKINILEALIFEKGENIGELNKKIEEIKAKNDGKSEKLKNTADEMKSSITELSKELELSKKRQSEIEEENIKLIQEIESLKSIDSNNSNHDSYSSDLGAKKDNTVKPTKKKSRPPVEPVKTPLEIMEEGESEGHIELDAISEEFENTHDDSVSNNQSISDETDEQKNQKGNATSY